MNQQQQSRQIASKSTDCIVLIYTQTHNTHFIVCSRVISPNSVLFISLVLFLFCSSFSFFILVFIKLISFFLFSQDSETQRRLEMLHRGEEDDLYRQFSKKRAEEEQNVNTVIQEEWEKELEKLTARYHYEMTKKQKKISMDEERAMTLRHQKDKDDLEKNMTIKLDRKKESLTKKLLEAERHATAELVEKQSKEMMNLITEKLQEFTISRSASNGKNATSSSATANGGGSNGHSSNGHRDRFHVNASIFDLFLFNFNFFVELFAQHSNSNADDSSDGKSSPSGSSYNSGIPVASYPSAPPPPNVPTISKLDIYSDPNVFAELDQIAINVRDATTI